MKPVKVKKLTPSLRLYPAVFFLLFFLFIKVPPMIFGGYLVFRNGFGIG